MTNTNRNEKLGLSVLEAGWLLQKTESQVRGMLRRGELAYAVEGHKVDFESVQNLLGSGFARACARWLRCGLIVAPPPERRWGKPVPLWVALDALLITGSAMRITNEIGKEHLSAKSDSTEYDRNHLSQCGGLWFVA